MEGEDHLTTFQVHIARIFFGLKASQGYLVAGGDGTQIGAEVVAQITASLDANTRSFAWQRGDVMVVDNVLSTHGREPFTGERRILVAMVGGVGA